MLRLFGKKSDHPLADIKSVQALLDEMPKSDPLKVLQELTNWVESVCEQAAFRLDHQLAVLRLVDEAARPFERKLMREYFAGSTLSAFQENRLWMALNEFSGQVAHAYFNVLARYRDGDRNGSAVKAALPLVAVRGISAVRSRLKFAAVRYALVDAALWEYMAKFYSHAETLQYLDEQVPLYSGLKINTSVRCEFAAVMMWYASSTSTLSRLHVHLAERVAAHFGKNLTVDTQCSSESMFTFNLQSPSPPVRVNGEKTLQTGLRFLGVNDDLKLRTEALLKTLEKGVIPEEINLGGTYDVSAVRDAVRHLAAYWTSPPMRRSVRQNIKVNLSVVNGLSEVMEQTEVGLNFGGNASVAWNVENISEGGLGCVLPPSLGGVAIGLLLGIKLEETDHWGVGIVRRLSRDQQNNLQVGVEVLAKQITGVALRKQGASEEQPALWLNNPGDNPDEARLLINPDTFSDSRSLHVRLADRNYLLMPLGLVESGKDYELAHYRMLEEDTSESTELY